MKEITEKILIVTCLVALCIVLPFDYIRKSGIDEEIGQRIEVLEEEIKRVEGRDLSTETIPSFEIPGERSPFDFFNTNRILAGTCFYEFHELERFVVKKLQDKESLLVIYPPLNLDLIHRDEGVELSWSDNPLNQPLLKKLMNNPLLKLSYKVYRWQAGPKSQPEAIALLPYDRNHYIDYDLGPLGVRYYYNVLTVYGGKIGELDTLIESRQSETVDIDCIERFGLRIVDGKKDRVQVEISLNIGGNQITHIFPIEVGDEIGGPIDMPGIGQVDLSTSLTATEIVEREEMREESVNYPLFNANGSRTLDPITGRPVYQKRAVQRNVTVYSLECRDPWGNLRRIE